MKKRTKIIATIGPAVAQYEQLVALAEGGVNIFRLNFSHGDHSWHEDLIKKVKRINKKMPNNVAILLDTKGPEIRTGDIQNPIELKKGSKLILTTKFVTNPTEDDITKVSVNYDGFIHDVEVGEKVLVDNGVMNLRILSKNKYEVECEVLDGGLLKSRRHLNLPGKDVSLESITEKDWKDIKFGIEMGVDFIALSFVRSDVEIKELKAFLTEQNSNIEIIAKIESFEATKNLEKIVQAADGIMVARGDLGAEIPFSHVPQVQKDIIDLGAKYQKPVIVATHMLESMIENPIPTRAEVTDIFVAVHQKADCTMLSGETAAGKFPLKSVETMAEVIMETEKNELKDWKYRDIKTNDTRSEFCKSAARIAGDMKEVTAIMVITRSGFMANMVSSFRPCVPIYAFTNEPSSRRKMHILHGVQSYRIDFSSTPQKTIQRARQKFLEFNPDQKGKKYILVSDFMVDDEFVPTLQIREF